MAERDVYWWDIIGTASDPELTGFLLHEKGGLGFDWSNPAELHCYFHGTRAEQERFIKSARAVGFEILHSERLPLMDWNASAEHDWRSVSVGDVLLSPLIETEEDKPLDPSSPLQFFIHPASGFGTGHHTTTQATLDLLLSIRDSKVSRVLDAGTGSGVLAMVACRLFGATAHGIDKDEVALEYARRTVAANGLAGKITLSTAPIETITEPFDLILANVYSEYHDRNEAVYYRLLSKGNALIMSGIARETRSEFEAKFEARWSLIRSREDGRWITSLYRRT